MVAPLSELPAYPLPPHNGGRGGEGVVGAPLSGLPAGCSFYPNPAHPLLSVLSNQELLPGQWCYCSYHRFPRYSQGPENPAFSTVQVKTEQGTLREKEFVWMQPDYVRITHVRGACVCACTQVCPRTCV